METCNSTTATQKWTLTGPTAGHYTIAEATNTNLVLAAPNTSSGQQLILATAWPGATLHQWILIGV